MRRSLSASLAISALFAVNYLTRISQAYYIDDSNTTAIQYIPPSKWTHNSTDANVDFSKLYLSTYTYALCLSRDGCKIWIPFTGSGITVYHLMWDHLNASISLDTVLLTAYVHDASCIRQTPFGCYNTTLYDNQSLAYGNHVLEISLQDYSGTQSDFNIDYVFVNETQHSPTATATPSGVPPKRTPTAAIVGGSIGGLAVVIVTILLMLCVLRRRSRTHNDGQTFIDETPFILPAATSVPATSSPVSVSVPIPQNAPAVIPTPFRHGPSTSSSGSKAMYLGTSKASTSTFGQGTVGTPASGTMLSAAPASEADNPTQNATQGRFTGEQISSMTQRLVRQNVPAPIVATVVESMIGANAEASASTSQIQVCGAEGSGAGSVHGAGLDVPPPSYDYKAR